MDIWINLVMNGLKVHQELKVKNLNGMFNCLKQEESNLDGLVGMVSI
ncbi:putative yD repeat protein [Neisseria meningitidis NM2866]|nr:hypothetical protein NGFG_02270 [Neisseria gonorrhoeae MS11]AKP13871.1 hypothetical protein WX60_02001 [Neisseria gonorrhoeae]ANW71247.1 adhesin [Neisseria meningitidis]EJU53367.1 putative adhesin domain protein [Neisseria meningitidis 93003]EQD07169.1 putative yD repeat protein [Neisseria meningitidis NM045]EQD22637.1 putative yD repeat protein [Neisseria meningitidis NM2866]KLR81905.1 adhesin [Neisseria gonorrhoeae SK7842]KLR89658.1 adhesin [Neisseria gonorrhoeae SK6987]KLR94290.1 adhe